MSAQSWQITILTYLLFVLVAGLAFNMPWHRGARISDAPGKRIWDSYDSWALLLVVALGVVLAWLAVTLPLTGDEASELEPDFWKNWFFNPIRGSQPPLGRLVNHLWVFLPEPKWLIRLPYLLFWLAGVWVFYKLARRRTGGNSSLFWTVLFACSGIFILPDHQQTKYALWLFALLACQGSFERALSGERRQWVCYALWIWLASLTYYFTIPYALGHLYFVFFKKREQLKPLIKALLPAVLSLLPFAWPVLNGNADTRSSFAGGVGLALGLCRIGGEIVLAPGMLGLGLLWLAWRDRVSGSSGKPAALGGSAALPAMIVLGLLFPLPFAGYMRMSSRLFIPVLPFGLLWVAGRVLPGWVSWNRRRRWLSAAGVGMVFLVGAGIGVNIFLEQRDNLWSRYVGQSRLFLNGQEHERYLLMRSHQVLVSCYELSDSRKYWLLEQDWSDGVKWYHIGRTWLSPLPDKFDPRRLEATLERSPEFDLLWQGSRRLPFSDVVQTWLDHHCRLLLRSDSWPVSFGVVYRCRRIPDST
ncbi:MAG TPA: glycosyltransferase family 39 protein [Myxococcota bacterium]|nr:glycosyltransferase family 39 protein [Myxococcota bacterium]